MSVWRQKMMEYLPEQKKELEEQDLSIYYAFSMLLQATIKAHKEGEHEKLKKYYAFAEWCSMQKAQHLWNAAGVSFYEHLADQEETLSDMHKWVKKSTYMGIRPLLELRLDKEAMQGLDKLYQLL